MDERERILVVDDDESTCRTLKLILEKQGYETDTAGTGQEAIEKARERFFNAALLDIRLPGVEGIELLTPLKEMHPDIAVLMVTGHASLESAVQALNAGASAYVIKPLNMDEVLNTVREVLEKQRLVMENRRLYEEAQRELTERKKTEEALRRRAALDRVRVSVYEARESVDIQKILTSLYEALKELGVDFEGCSVQVVDKEKGTFTGYGVRPDGVYPTRERPLMDSVVYDVWRDKRPAYRRNLDEEDRYDEGMRLREVCGKHIRSVLDVPFSRGTIAVNSVQPEAFSEEDIETLRQFSEVLSEAYTRFEDIRRIEESEERYRALFEQGADSIVLVNAETGALVEFNDRAHENLGYTREEFEKLKIPDLEFVESAEEVAEHIEKVVKEGSTTFETKHRTKAGEIRDVEVSCRTICLRGRDFIQSIWRDITERKQAEERVRRQQRLAAVGQLAAGIAHDFNNLLTGIIGFAELLQLREDMPESAKTGLKSIEREGQRAAQLVRQILDFSRQCVIQRQPLDLLSCLKESVKFLKRTLPENIRVIMDRGRREHLVNADPTQMQQVMTNLAVNARDAMPEGGELRVRLSKLTLDTGERPPFPGMPPGEWVVFSVSDTGVGIPPEVLPHVYEPFVTTKEVGKGSGLGLSQVYGIVKQHEGFIDVASEVGKGTAVSIYLPALSVVKEMSEEKAPEELSRGRGEMILVVEDEPIVLETTGRMLEQLGCRALLVGSGEEAMEVYEKHRDEIVMVLTDLVMPGISGITLTRALKAQNPEVKVVVMSGYTLEDEIERFQAQGIAAWVQKPIEISSLIRLVREVLT